MEKTYSIEEHNSTAGTAPRGILRRSARLVRTLLFLMAMTLGTAAAWGETDYSGVYFIANGNTSGGNFYLVPATNSNYGNDVNKPHLTTSKTGQVLNSCWQIVKIEDGDYYRIIHVADGKYLTANPEYAGTSGNDVGRLRVHLEEMTTPDDNTLFEIKVNSNGGYNIRHKDMADVINNTSAVYLDPAGGNIDGTNVTGARTATTSSGKINVGGGIGYWSDEPAARWIFEPVPQNNTYTYHIVDRSGDIAISYTVTNQAAAKTLSSDTDIPEQIRSPYLAGETMTFYSFDGAYSASNLTNANKIIATPVTDNANIYVKYTVSHLTDEGKDMDLQGTCPFNIKVDDNYYYNNAGTLSTTSADLTTRNRLWYFIGNDPYAVQIKNIDTTNGNKYLTYFTSSNALSLSGTAESFILMGTSATQSGQQLYLRKKNGTTSDDYNSMIAIPVSFSTNYCLIDKAGRPIQDDIEGGSSSVLTLPDEWKSPLVSTYHFWKDNPYSYDSETDTYTLKTGGDAPEEIESILDAGSKTYVTYEADPTFNFDTDENDEIDATNTTYMLRYIGGQEFYQEESDKLMDSKLQAAYPYANGDGCLYVYGSEQWTEQSNSGMSTRTRWLWYAVSPNSDPYHVKFKSYQQQASTSHNYFRTYPVTYTEYKIESGNITSQQKSAVVTGVTTMREEVDASHDNELPTEYMVLKGPNGQCILKTVEDIDGERRTVTTFEQYWKTYETVSSNGTKNYAPPINNPMFTSKDITLNYYPAWAYARPINTSDPTDKKAKEYLHDNHWFQTIDMGSTGEFVFEPVALDPQIILIDQHGWEIMRRPLPSPSDDNATKSAKLAALRLYDSPMVQEYHWYPTSAKAPGYHKYSISDESQEFKIYEYNTSTKKWVDSGRTYSHNSTSLADSPYDHITPVQDKSVMSDFYVTYTVDPTYAGYYSGAATAIATSASALILKQGGKYAKAASSSSVTGADKPADLENVNEDLQWNLRPNFDIDEEMGYLYDIKEKESDTQPISKASTNSAYYNNGQAGFDPYNVQVQSKMYPTRYLVSNTTNPHLDGGVWAGTSSSLSLNDINDMEARQTATGHDQTTLHITNATFMVVDDGNGNMQLMPRFDHTKVATFDDSKPFKTLTTSSAAPANDDGAGTQSLAIAQVAKRIYSSDELTDMNGYYILGETFEFKSGFTSLGTKTRPFTGTIDGKGGIFDGPSVPLILYANNATVCNLTLRDITVSSGNAEGNAGAICCEAAGSTRIYNCGILSSTTNRDDKGNITGFSGSSVSGSNYVGGIVGLLSGTSRVINCFSYANITSGNVKAGIVGYNSYASKSKDVTNGEIRTMVMNCMFYGNITCSATGTDDSVYPIYGGEKISNEDDSRLNNYNYFLYEADYSQGKHIPGANYNCALAAEERYLVRWEFYRNLLNSTRELAAWYATGSTANGKGTKETNKMLKWVLDKSIAPYPILKEQGTYPSAVNYDPEYTNDATTGAKISRSTVTEHNKGGILTNMGTGGQLSVTISSTKTTGGQTWPTGATVTQTDTTLYIIDKDSVNFNYNYGKVQLPYYNDVGTGNYTHDRVVTGWKITAITAVADDPYTAANYTGNKYDSPNYNFADRKSSNKDKYDVSGRVFSQGAYFDVPDGVTSITIEPYWACAAYVSDKYYDCYGKNQYEMGNGVTDFGEKYNNGSQHFINGDKQNVYNSLINAYNRLVNLGLTTNTSSVYDYAIVLVGNCHQKGSPHNKSSVERRFTMMSADLNFDNEPDYSLIVTTGKQETTNPIRFDFINVPGVAMAHKKTSNTYMGILGNLKPKGWFETTNTATIRFSQFEYDSENKTLNDPLILMGGIVDMFTSTNGSAASTHTKYMIMGGNVYFQVFNIGCHMDKTYATPHRPISVTGGDYDKFYLSGYLRPDANAFTTTDGGQNAECYISGGRFGEVAGAGYEQIAGDVNWQIYNADIDEFYGGGINHNQPIQGNITTKIYDSHVGLFCGGPKFGNMSTGKTVETTASGCTFGNYFGAGYGGTALTRVNVYNKYGTLTYAWNGTTEKLKMAPQFTDADGANHRGKYVSGQGISINYDYRNFEGSSTNTVAYLFVNYASLSLAQTNNATSTLTNCTIDNNFYGGGRLGKVAGNVTSSLTGCTVNGSVFGAGFSADVPTADVFPDGNAGLFQTIPVYNSTTGVFEKGVYPTAVKYTWSNDKGSSSNYLVDEGNNHYIFVDRNEVDLTQLGTVTGKVTLDIDEGTTIAGNVYGGGESSDATGDVEVNINDGTMVDVYGGGMGKTTVVGGNVVVNIGSKSDDTPPVYAGNATISGSVYGGSALGNTNATKSPANGTISYTTGKATQVNLYKGTVIGSVFGGGLGQLAVGAAGEEGYVAPIASNVYGPVTVTAEGPIMAGNVFGCNNLYGAPQSTVAVLIDSTAVATNESPNPIGNVYGGGNLAAYTGSPTVTMTGGTVDKVYGGGYGASAIITGNTSVTLSGGKVNHDIYGGGDAANVTGTVSVSITGGTVTHDVYGGGALANTNTASTVVNNRTVYPTTTVSLTGGTIDNVYGGGLGRKASDDADAVEAKSGKVLVELNKGVTGKGCIVNQVFGANNANGTPLDSVTVHVYATQNRNLGTVNDYYNPPYAAGKSMSEGYKAYLQRLVDTAKPGGALLEGVDETKVTPAEEILSRLASTDEAQLSKQDTLDIKAAAEALSTAFSGLYDVKAVYGGGNEAEYIPTDTLGTTTVIIEGCDVTTIESVYGGGNAAAVPATDVTLLSAHAIDYLFGGGNGIVAAANVGYEGTKYSGKAVTRLIGGTVYHVYGGSNTQGDVLGGTSVSMPETNDCPLVVKQIYGAGQNAEQSGSASLILAYCQDDPNRVIYGGSRDADMHGDVNIVITAGHIKQLFGGNDNSGNIFGSITVTIEETGCEPVKIDELYLGGNQAAYSVYGYDNQGPLTETGLRNKIATDNPGATEEKLQELFEKAKYTDPVLNIVSCTNIGKVYGGGLGQSATMHGNPTVNLNMIPGRYAKKIDRNNDGNDDNDEYALGTIGHVFGGGSEANVIGNTTVNIGTEQSVTMRSEKDELDNLVSHYVRGAYITGNIYGGGQEAEVIGDTRVNIRAKEVEVNNENVWQTVNYLQGGDVTIGGSVFGAGKGLDTDVTSAIVRGNSSVNMGGGSVKQNIYGGGEVASVGDFTFDPTSKDITACADNTGTSKVNFFGGTVGPDKQVKPAAYGHIFGAGQGLVGDNGLYPKLNYVQATEVTVSGATTVVEGSVFGGSENGHVRGDAAVIINGSTVGVDSIKKGGETVGNVYGGGKGSLGHFTSGIVKGNTEVTINGGTIYHNIYGGGAYGSVGTITLGPATYVPGKNSVADMPTAWAANTGKATITITGGNIGIDGDENGMIFGSSRGDVHAPENYSDPNDFSAWVYDTDVTIGTSDSDDGPAIKGSVYGSGENGHVFNDTDVKIYSGIIGIATGDSIKAFNYAINDSVKYAADDYPFRGNVYGGGCGEDTYDDSGTATYNPLAGIVLGDTKITIDGGHVVHNVYGGGALGSVTGKATIDISGGRIGVNGNDDGNVYGASRGNNQTTQEHLAHVQTTEVNIKPHTSDDTKSPVIWNNVYGGGEAGIVKGSVAVNVSGGTVTNDVYGGGALAHTNTDNWDATKTADLYVAKTGLTLPAYTAVTVETGADVSNYYTESNGTYTAATGTAVAGVTYYQKTKVGSSVNGYYTRTGDAAPYTYTAASGEAKANTIYYEKTTTTGDWKASAPYDTKVKLTGGTVGNVYGGGLGSSTIAANVYGDVKVTVNKEDKTGTAKFTKISESRTFNRTITDAVNNVIQQSVTEDFYTTGRVFGCNNINGTPKGNVTVTVWSTTPLGGGAHKVSDYEIQEVYGGGNLAAYRPAEGKKTEVHIHGCDATSILYVFGGGNAATVPETDVNIHGCFEIETVFGGGNGNEPVKDAQGHWVESNGADVPGIAKLSLMGGTIHSAFAGSFVKGTCGVTVLDDKNTTGGDGCALKVTNLYGGGKDAPVVNGININISGCSSDNNQIENIYAGSYNARIFSGITMNITGGIFKNVFGGNHQGGFINGPIVINVEETDHCKPIIIDSLYGSGNFAPYPGPGTTATGKITINIKSCTRIGEVYGGGFGSNADVTGNTEVNINMVKGYWAGRQYPPENGRTIPDSIGVIGNVFGGGNMGSIIGNATVNIGTAKTVDIMKRNAQGLIVDKQGNPAYDANGMLIAGSVVDSVKQTVIGARILGDVYGGGNLADVTGNTYVNICAKENDHVYEAVTFHVDSVTIGGNVYGGGKGVADNFFCDKGMVGVNNQNQGSYSAADSISGTHVNIGGGKVKGNVYGGGQIGRVEYNTDVTIGYGNGTEGAAKSPVIEGSVFAAGKGVNSHGYSALVRGNSKLTIQGDAKVGQSVYGGGEIASVGKYQVVDGMPQALVSQKLGKCYVTVKGKAEIGPDGMKMNKTGGAAPDFTGHVFGAGKGAIPYEGYADTKQPFQVLPATTVYYKTKQAIGDDVDNDYMTFIETLALATETHVTIGGQAFVKGSVYGGSENGHVQFDTHVTIQDSCQIGNGDGVNRRYTKQEWAGTSLAECAHWAYDNTSGAPYDKYAIYESGGKYYYDDAHTKYAEGGAATAKDGHTYYGNVFGGGSGVAPYAPGKWHRNGGSVGGDAMVIITGGHILTNVYGGNEQTDVAGDAYIIMTGGTLGVPRTRQDIIDHPVTCYLFGAGKGDQRIFFNTWTNVRNAYIHISDSARIFGSVFGGGEDGHVHGDVKMNVGSNTLNGLIPDSILTHNPVIKALSLSGTKTVGAIQYPYIGTTGTSYVDGNVFGGGRGFSGEALTAGTIGGNVDVDIKGGTMLGSIYGGGRLASVGTFFTDPNDDEYGQLKEDDDDNTYGHITVNISGGTIGNTTLASNAEGIEHSGNVFGGSMGRLTLLDGTTLNPLWPELAEAKTAVVNITGDATRITRNVYGGGEFGTVRENAYVTIGGTGDTSGTVVADGSAPTIDGNVFGGGYGSDIYDEPTTIEVHWSGAPAYYTYTPMQWAGSVGGNTYVNICKGTIGKNVYGGGELASVGIVDYSVKPDENGPFTYKGNKYAYNTVKKHDSQTTDGKTLFDFGLSWPYEFKYVPCSPTDTEARGETTVNVIDGTIGGYVFGAGKGKVDFGGTDSIKTHRYKEAYCANVRYSNVTIGTNGGSGTTPSIGYSVYGGGEDGHVYEDATVTIHHGTINRSVFGGGKGEGKYKTVLWDQSTPGANKQNGNTVVEDSVYSWTAGKVYGNTKVTMYDGQVNLFVYGGGNMGSVGKGSYAGGADDYALNGYGELPEKNLNASGVNLSNLWTTSSTDASETKDMAYHFLKSGNSSVTILGGTVGSTGTDSDGIPYGAVFGGSRGKAAADCRLSPRYRYVPDFFLGYVNNAMINIGGFINEDGDTTVATTGPTIKGSVYGGGQDGHVRNSTEVRVFKGDIEGQGDEAGRSGHVFGAGSGIGKYKAGDNKEYCNNASGSVTCTTLVEVLSGTINGNVYGGGAMASVGPPNTGALTGLGFDELNNTTTPYPRPDGIYKSFTAHKSKSYTQVNIKGGTVKGSVFAASRGPSDQFRQEQFIGKSLAYDSTKYATDIWSNVVISDSSKIRGSVYGGGEAGVVKRNTTVSLTGGTIDHDAYGGGKGTAITAANVGGNTTTELNKDVAINTRGCSVKRIFGCNDRSGTPMGHVYVHVYATQNAAKQAIRDKSGEGGYDIDEITNVDSLKTFLKDKIAIANAIEVPTTSYQSVADDNSATAAALTEALKALNAKIDTAAETHLDTYKSFYDMEAVYGGGNLAIYDPKDNEERTEVIIDGCHLTSIYQAYGGSNAAPAPATYIRVNGTHEIYEVFGGGNGADGYELDGYHYENPGANVGYRNYTHFGDAGKGTGSAEDPYQAVDNYDALTKDNRRTYYLYGTGVATTEIAGGYIHKAYGGSNKKGNICTTALSKYEGMDDDCPLKVGETYGGSKDAPLDGTIDLTMDCVKNMDVIYGGSKSSDVNANIKLNITNGTFKKVFGGNNTSGAIIGSITVNVEEKGCQPVFIEELYSGGYLAPYSIYGYEQKQNGTLEGDTIDGIIHRIPITKARREQLVPLYESQKAASEQWLASHDETDENWPRYKAQLATLEDLLDNYPMKDPRINVISATRIDTIYGGGYKAMVVGNPRINVNMTEGHIDKRFMDGGTAGPFVYKDSTYTIAGVDDGGYGVLNIGSIGNIYGGGNLADIAGDTYIEIGTGQWINDDEKWEMIDSYNNTYTYEDRSDSDPKNWRSKWNDDKTIGVWKWYDQDSIAATTTLLPARNEARITGDVFGGGKGEAPGEGVADAFFCTAAMVGINNEGKTDPNGGTSIIIENGTVDGNVYGGGEVGRVEKSTKVTIGKEGDQTNEPEIKGSVFGAGKGVNTHGYSALVRGNTTVTVQGQAKVRGSVYGGGELASVGRYNVASKDSANYQELLAQGIEDGMPYSLVSNLSGNCNVIVKDYAEIGPDDMKMTAENGPDNAGHVFGAGKGVMAYEGYDATHLPWRMPPSGVKEEYSDTTAYLKYLKTLALATQTEVTIGGHAFVKGDVFGGGEDGYVQHDTHVTIQDSCQIGNGYILLVNNGDTIANYGVNRRYTDEEWKQGKLIGDDRWTTASLPECAHWPYGIEVDEDGVTKKIFAQYDKFANKTGNLEQYSNGTSTGHGRFKGSDGHTFYGNVFGGGSGYFPYAPGKWNHNAGYIGGNTHVTITGGHILTNVYGGSEMTDVRDTCFIKMTGGTLGVPRTLEQIAAHPVTCYLFGGGMGDPRTFFNKHTNVGSVDIEISGGHIYGSVFGGAEDGHVEHDVKMDIKPGAKIGTWGTSYVDGNVFGGGRGFSGETMTAGNVGDSVVINITGGKMLGSIYGGGRLGSVGYDLKDVNEVGYGKLSTDPTRGHVVVNISGGTIGNDHEYTYIAPNATESQVAAAKVNMPNTLHDADNRLQHTKGGNVFTGGMGRFYLLDDSTVISHWYDLGKVKSTRLTVSDSARIKSNIYGGCELGWVGGKHKVDGHAHADSLSTEILIKGGTSASPVIGTEIKDNSGVTRYTFGSVFGGGRGSNMEKLYKDENEANVSDNPKFYAGRVVGSTDVKMEDGLVLGSVYGGGQVGNIGMASSYGEVADKKLSTNVTITGGTIGRDTLKVGGDSIYYGGATMGNVYGGGSGDRLIVRCGLVLGNSNVNISQAEGKTTRIYHNVYGGGAYGTVGDFNYVTEIDPNTQSIKVSQVADLHTDSTGIANVTITGGEIGIDGHNNGMIFGSSRGDVVGSQLRDDYMAWVYDANVKIGNEGGGYEAPQPRIHGSIYGGGENGHVLRDTHVDILSGYIGDSLSYYANRGNVYGAGCGTDTIMVNGVKRYKPLAGVVHGNTNVNISGGLITGGIYGAGSMAYVGTISNKNDTASVAKHMDIVTENGKENIYGLGLSWPYKFEFVDTTGTATINITGGHIGINGTDGGDVYGSARGEAGDRYITAHHAFVKEAIINIDLPKTAPVSDLDKPEEPCITGSVHGSGEDGYVYGDTHVTLNKGLIGHSVYGGGKGKGTYKMTLDRWSATGETGTYEADIYSLISGKVLGNTYVTMNDGHVVRNIYGGGNMGSVGKGNYAGAADDYFTGGYGELTRDSLWSNHNEYSQAFLNSGKTTVKVLAGTVGNPNKLTEFKEGLPLGNVFGGSRGVAAPNVPNTLSPRYYYCPTFFSGYVNETEVIIGTDSTAGPNILCSVYGGAQDGHVRRWTDVKINSGTIGLPFTAENKNLMGKDNINDSLWLYRGNVYGAGSGISEFKYDFNGKNGYADTFKVVGNNGTTFYPERGYSTSAGSVTCFTKVDIKGGTIYRNVAGGGSLASVGPLKLPYFNDYAAIKGDDPKDWGKQSLNEVIIGGGKTKDGQVRRITIGDPSSVAAGYGGNVFGGSRGDADKGSGYATSVWTKVYVKDGANILGSVFGGGNAGTVYKDTDVQIGEPKNGD